MACRDSKSSAHKKRVYEAVLKKNPGMKEKAARIANASSKPEKIASDTVYKSASGKNIYPEVLTDIATTASRRYVRDRTPLNTTIAKEADDLTQQQVRTICQLANRFTHHKLRKEAGAFVQFPLAMTQSVTKVLMDNRSKGAVEKVASAPDRMVEFPMFQSRPVSTNSVKWGMRKTASLRTSTDIHREKQECADALLGTLKQLDKDIHHLVKHAGVSQGEIMMAAVKVDADAVVPFCLSYCSRVLDEEECTDIEKFASMTIDDENPIVQNFKRVQFYGSKYASLLPENEAKKFVSGVMLTLPKEAEAKPGAAPKSFMSKAKALGGKAFGKLNTGLYGFTMFEGASKGMKAAKSGHNKVMFKAPGASGAIRA